MEQNFNELEGQDANLEPIELTIEDASILSRVARYPLISKESKLLLLEKASEPAKRVGRVILGEEQASPDIASVAALYKRWGSSENKVYISARRANTVRRKTAKSR